MAERKRFAVHWVVSAAQDLHAIVDRLSSESVVAAERVLEKLAATASRLYVFPYRGRLVPELKDHGILLYREVFCAPWRIIYRVEEAAVIIFAVIDGRRNLEDLLLDRFLR